MQAKQTGRRQGKSKQVDHADAEEAGSAPVNVKKHFLVVAGARARSKNFRQAWMDVRVCLPILDQPMMYIWCKYSMGLSEHLPAPASVILNPPMLLSVR